MVTHQVIADRFEVGEFIVQGGMGAVYRGVGRRTGQPNVIVLVCVYAICPLTNF